MRAGNGGQVSLKDPRLRFRKAADGGVLRLARKVNQIVQGREQPRAFYAGDARNERKSQQILLSQLLQGRVKRPQVIHHVCLSLRGKGRILAQHMGNQGVVLVNQYHYGLPMRLTQTHRGSEQGGARRYVRRGRGQIQYCALLAYRLA